MISCLHIGLSLNTTIPVSLNFLPNAVPSRQLVLQHISDETKHENEILLLYINRQVLDREIQALCTSLQQTTQGTPLVKSNYPKVLLQVDAKTMLLSLSSLSSISNTVKTLRGLATALYST